MRKSMLYSADQMISFRAADNAALRARVHVLEDALSLAYGHLWCINNEPGTPSPLRSAMDAAYAARMVLRHLLTTEQRGNGIDAVRTALEANR